MITTRRSEDGSNSSYASFSSKAGVGLLERPVDNAQVYQRQETESEQAERMKTNLAKLLNYDVVQTEVSEEAEKIVDSAIAGTEVMETVDMTATEEDIRPTVTTMQFSDGESEQILNEMKRTKNEEKVSYRINARGKFLIALYSLAVVIILALIVLNTGVLAGIRNAKAAKLAEIEGLKIEYSAITEEIESISSEQYVTSQAEKMGMIK
ncbi:MAG: hypothetical protein J6Q32_03125, partial [Clostridia bacterium]|nr:hypothetical protein [Clostridia bacterium]